MRAGVTIAAFEGVRRPLGEASHLNRTVGDGDVAPRPSAWNNVAADHVPQRSPMPRAARSIAVFDLGGVLIDWNPRHLYRKLFPGDEAGMEHFLEHVCNQAWNERQDAGRSIAEGVALLKAEHPNKANLIDAFYGRWHEMVAGAIDGTVAVFEELHRRDVPLYALSNWSAETFPYARTRFDFLRRFRGIVLSGEVGLVKPDPRIFRLLLERHGFAAADSVYIDDVERNVAAARALGFDAIRFTEPSALRRRLEELSFL
jgi:2-haloacid dehalogenase